MVCAGRRSGVTEQDKAHLSGEAVDECLCRQGRTSQAVLQMLHVSRHAPPPCTCTVVSPPSLTGRHCEAADGPPHGCAEQVLRPHDAHALLRHLDALAMQLLACPFSNPYAQTLAMQLLACPPLLKPLCQTLTLDAHALTWHPDVPQTHLLVCLFLPPPPYPCRHRSAQDSHLPTCWRRRMSGMNSGPGQGSH